MLAELCVAHDLVAICDEVWEAVRFEGPSHRSLLAFPGMAGRAIKIGSAGKLFGLTGWKLGWMAAGPELARVAARAHQFLTFTTIPATQWALAEGLGRADILAERLSGWAATRSVLNGLLDQAGLVALPALRRGSPAWTLPLRALP
jgi:aspartate/methionine/tyrosine aminotransferase